ncbi:MAG: tetratricopeptide repeat protein [Acidobacteriota bacterium]
MRPYVAPMIALTFATVAVSAASEIPAGAPANGARAEAYLLFLDAQDLLQQGKWREARKQLEQVIELDPNAVQVQSTLARLCLREEDLACAEARSRKAIELDPDEASARRVLAEILIGRYRRSNDPQALTGALTQLEAAARIDPRDTPTWVAWIRLLGGEGRIDQAVEVTQRAAAVPGADPAPPWMALARVLLARGEAERAIRLLDNVHVTGRGAIPVLETLADLKGSRGDLAGQETTLVRLRELKPDDIDVAQRLGAVRLDLGDPYGALEPLQSALRARPADAIVRRDLARAQVKLGRGAEALTLLDGLPEVYRSSHAVLLWAQAAEQASQPKLAADKLEDLMTRLSDEDRASFGSAVRLRAAQNRFKEGNHARVLALVGNVDDDVTALRLKYAALDALGRRAEVESELQQRLAAKTGNAPLIALAAAWDPNVDRNTATDAALTPLLTALHGFADRVAGAAEIAQWLISLQRPQLAARLLDAVGLPEEPSNDVLRIRAATLDAAGRAGEAEAAFRRLLLLEPDNDVLLNDLGWLLAKEGRSLDEAIKLLERAVQKRPEEPAYLDSLGWALHRAGRSSEALPMLRRAAQRAVERDEPEIREHLGDVYFALGDSQRAKAEWGAAISLGALSRERLQKKLDEMESAQKALQP